MQTVFDQIKDRLPITEVLSSYIALTPSGSQYKAKCPFHQERSASFSVSPERGLYYCFGCGAKGDIFTFVEQFEGLDKKGALKVLADRAGVVLTQSVVQRESTDPLYDVLEQATVRYQHELARSTRALEYLHSRGLSDQTIAMFRIGYVPDEWRYIASGLASQEQEVFAERAGLVKKTDKGYYDRFRKRVMFPLTDASGRVVGFSGRIFPADPELDKQSPKYLNSPETELFQKSRILFGFDKAKGAIRHHNFAILVEGQMDCVLAHQAGFRNTVATSGTAVSEDAAHDPTANLVVLSRLTSNVFLAFDGDTAGQKALNRAALVALSLGMNPRVVPLPAGTDPADYILAHGQEGWKQLLKESKHFIVHQLASIDRASMSPHTLVHVLKEKVFPYLVRITSPIEQSSYIETVARTLSLPHADVARELALYAATTTRDKPTDQVIETITRETATPEERFVALVTRYPTEGMVRARTTLMDVSFGAHRFAFPVVTPERMIELTALVERDYGALTDTERDVLAQEFVHKLTERFFASLRTELTAALAYAESQGDEEQTTALMQELQELNKRRHGAP